MTGTTRLKERRVRFISSEADITKRTPPLRVLNIPSPVWRAATVLAHSRGVKVLQGGLSGEQAAAFALAVREALPEPMGVVSHRASTRFTAVGQAREFLASPVHQDNLRRLLEFLERGRDVEVTA